MTRFRVAAGLTSLALLVTASPALAQQADASYDTTRAQLTAAQQAERQAASAVQAAHNRARAAKVAYDQARAAHVSADNKLAAARVAVPVTHRKALTARTAATQAADDAARLRTQHKSVLDSFAAASRTRHTRWVAEQNAAKVLADAQAKVATASYAVRQIDAQVTSHRLRTIDAQKAAATATDTANKAKSLADAHAANVKRIGDIVNLGSAVYRCSANDGTVGTWGTRVCLGRDPNSSYSNPHPDCHSRRSFSSSYCYKSEIDSYNSAARMAANTKAGYETARKAQLAAIATKTSMEAELARLRSVQSQRSAVHTAAVGARDSARNKHNATAVELTRAVHAYDASAAAARPAREAIAAADRKSTQAAAAARQAAETARRAVAALPAAEAARSRARDAETTSGQTLLTAQKTLQQAQAAHATAAQAMQAAAQANHVAYQAAVAAAEADPAGDADAIAEPATPQVSDVPEGDPTGLGDGGLLPFPSTSDQVADEIARGIIPTEVPVEPTTKPTTDSLANPDLTPTGASGALGTGMLIVLLLVAAGGAYVVVQRKGLGFAGVRPTTSTGTPSTGAVKTPKVKPAKLSKPKNAKTGTAAAADGAALPSLAEAGGPAPLTGTTLPFGVSPDFVPGAPAPTHASSPMTSPAMLPVRIIDTAGATFHLSDGQLPIFNVAGGPTAVLEAIVALTGWPLVTSGDDALTLESSAAGLLLHIPAVAPPARCGGTWR